MKLCFKKIVPFSIILLIFPIFDANAQLGFCNGNSGTPIFVEDFGTGTANGPQLPAGTTTYTFVNGTPDDGYYTISSSTAYFDWHSTPDHTPNDTNGKAFIVNADFTAGEFYRRTVDGLCESTSYEFSAWLLNLLPLASCNGAGIPNNVKFQIWDNTDTNLLATGDTNTIVGSATPIWRQFGLVFQTLPSQTSVILKMINNGNGGCGNDLAIDDIVFRTCGDAIVITNEQNQSFTAVCEDLGGISSTLTATPDYAVFSTHSYQWQISSDHIVWSDILGETNDTYVTPFLTTSTYFRVVVAEDPINIANNLCNIISGEYDVLVIPIPDSPISKGDVSICANESQALMVEVPDGIVVDWYDALVGGSLLQENSTSFLAQNPGTYYAEANSSIAGCRSITRTPVTITFFELPKVSDEISTFCENTTIILDADLANMAYAWNTGENTQQIVVGQQGIYTVEVTNANGCSAVRSITLEQIDIPIIENVVSDGYSIIVKTVKSGAFEYSSNGRFFQDSNILTNIPGGRYTIYVREKNGCGIVNLDYIHFVIPKFFTPNGDGANDVFIFEGIELFDSFDISIFDRFGKLIKHVKNNTFTWDGTYQGRDLPASDYWYHLKIDGRTLQGHFALKR